MQLRVIGVLTDLIEHGTQREVIVEQADGAEAVGNGVADLVDVENGSCRPPLLFGWTPLLCGHCGHEAEAVGKAGEERACRRTSQPIP